MRAFRIHSYGGPEVQVFDDIPAPIPRKGELLVKVAGSGLNPADVMIRSGYPVGVQTLPKTMGIELSGIVEGLGEGVEGWSVGDAAYGSSWHGTLAEYAVIEASAAGHPPANMDLADASLVPVGALTAWQCLEAGGLTEGQTVLIHRGAGGVGTYAIQFAKMRGAHVIATASPRNHHLLRELGADEVLDYHTVDVTATVKNADMVLESISPENGVKSMKTLKHGGIVVSIVGPIEPTAHHRTVLVIAEGDGASLDTFAGMILDLKLKPIIDTMLPFDRTADAIAELEKGHIVGKIGVRVS